MARAREHKERKTDRVRRARRRGRKARDGERTRYLKLHGSVYYLLSAISASIEKVHPTDDRTMICALDVLESTRSINEETRTREERPRHLSIVCESQFESFFLAIDFAPGLFFPLSTRKWRQRTISRDNFACDAIMILTYVWLTRKRQYTLYSKRNKTRAYRRDAYISQRI